MIMDIYSLQPKYLNTLTDMNIHNRILNIQMENKKTIHIPIKKLEKQFITEAARKEHLKTCSFVRRISLFEAERILNRKFTEEPAE